MSASTLKVLKWRFPFREDAGKKSEKAGLEKLAQAAGGQLGRKQDEEGGKKKRRNNEVLLCC